MAVVFAVPTGFSPKNVANILLWFDGADASSLTFSGSNITQWSDKSGNANHGTRAAGSTCPTQLTAALNGLNTVLFTRSNSQYLDLTTPIVAGTQYTCFAVLKASSQSSHAGGTFGSSSGPGGTLLELNTNAGTFAGVYWNTTTGYMGDDGGVHQRTDTASYHHIYCLATGDGAGSNYYDGASEPNQAFHASSASYNLIYVGREISNYVDCAIAEAILYSGIISNANIISINNYLTAKWGV
jgi:hypothetical protein